MKLKLTQLNKGFIKSTYVGKIKFSDLEKIATITFRTISKDGSDNGLFQRPSDNDKISKLSNFLSEKLLNDDDLLIKEQDSIVIFPTAIIISINQIDPDNDLEVLWQEPYLEFEDNSYNAFIVDGQHRFLGIKKFYLDNKLTEKDIDIELPVTVLVGYDIWEQSKIFAEVNFNQKPVNKSLYYDLFGSMPGEPSKEKLAHSLVKYLNHENEGPFEGLIKMLGAGPGVVSQAFLVEKIMKLFAPKNALSIFYSDYSNKQANQKILATTISVYFDAIKNRFIEYYPVKNKDNEYSSKDQNILLKTTGIGAFCRLLNEFEEVIKMNSHDTDYLKKYFARIFSLISNEEALELFSKMGKFAGGSSEGTQVRLYKRLSEIINYRKDVLGKIHQNAKILDVNLKDVHGRNMHELKLDNGTTNIISDEDLLKIKNS